MKKLQNQLLEKIKQSQSPVATSSIPFSVATTHFPENMYVFSNPQNANLSITCIGKGLKPQENENKNQNENNSHQTHQTQSAGSNHGNRNERLEQVSGSQEAKMMLGKVETLKSLLSNRLSLALKQQKMGETDPRARSTQSIIPSPQAEKREEGRLKESLQWEKHGEGELGIESALGRGQSSEWSGMGQNELISMMDSKIAELKRVLSKQ